MARGHFRTLASPLAVLVACAAPLLAATQQPDSARPGRPDQVQWLNRRGAVSTQTGTVTENALDQVVVEHNGKKRELSSSDVLRITYGSVPPAYTEGAAYFDRGGFVESAAKFRVAATDATARDVVKAHARLRAAEALMRQGASDASAFVEARDEAGKFRTDHPTSRDLPRARMLEARATQLAGDAKKAADLYRALYREGAGEPATTGYPRPLCFVAGLRAADAYLVAEDTLAAREVYSEMESGLPRILATLEVGARGRDELVAVQGQVRLGEGWSLLASGSVGQARTFFKGQTGGATPVHPQVLYGARLGLAEALLAEGKAREAQLEFAYVAAIDHTNRDRAARALVGLAESTLKLPDSDARQSARTWLQTVVDRYGDTPAALAAREKLATL